MENGKKWGGCLVILALLLALSWGIYEGKYYFSKWSDYRDRPWAYSRDPKAKLLVGVWEGGFSDPDKIAKTIHIEIFEPTTEEERKARASKRSRRRGGIRHKDKRGFDGFATITSKLGTEKYEIYGAVNKDDYQRFQFAFRPEDEKQRILPNFLVLDAKNGSWKGDEITFTLSFGYFLTNGSSYSSSADPRYSYTYSVKLSRRYSGHFYKGSNGWASYTDNSLYS